MRFLADENFDNDILRGILSKRADFDYVRVQDTEIYQADDVTVLAWAAREQRILLTHDAKTMPGPALRIAAGADGALWFTENYPPRIGHITTDGDITEFELCPSTGPVGITAGSDKMIWFTEYNGNRIGRISMAGEITEYMIPTPRSKPYSIVVGPDGAIWFTELNSNKIGRLQP